MKLVLHIGTEKTGTTVIQNWLYENESVLREKGFYLCRSLGYPNNRRLSAYFQSSFDDFFLDHDIRTPEQKSDFFSSFVADLDVELAEAAIDCHTCIMSSEHLSSRLNTAEEVAGMAAFMKPRFSSMQVICYFRGQEALRHSLYSTALINGYTTSPEEFMADVGEGHYYFNYHQICSNWSEHFSPDRFDPAVYARADFPQGDVRRDFAARCDLPAHEMSYGERAANESLSPVQVFLLRLINSCRGKYLPDGGVDLIREALVNEVIAEPAFKVGKRRRGGGEGISPRFAASNQALFADFMPEHVPSFDVEETNAAPGSAESEDSAVHLLAALNAAIPLLSQLYHGAAENAGAGRVVGMLRLTDQMVNVLRDVALSAEAGNSISTEQSVALMEMAHAGRPTGPAIQDFLNRHKRHHESSDDTMAAEDVLGDAETPTD